MRVGLIADIHGNLHALETVLKTLEKESLDHILCAGDLVVYGAYPAETLKLLQDHKIPSVCGNYDYAVGFDQPKASRKPSSALNEPIKQVALDWTKQKLPWSCKQYLRSLPWRMDYHLGGCHIAVVHASLDALDDYLIPETPDDLHLLAKRVASDVVVIAHTHQPFVYLADETLIVNPGAVGRSLDGDARASFAILETETLSVEHHRLAYPVDRAADAIASSGMPPEIAEMVRLGLRRVEQLGEQRQKAAAFE